MVTNWKTEKGKSNDSKNELIVSLFWIGFVIYILSYVISTTNEVNYIICNIIQVVGLIMFLPSAVILIKLKLENNYLRVIFPVYIIWLIVSLLRGVQFDYLTIKQLLFDPNSGMFLYLVPLVIFIPFTPAFLKKVFLVIIVLGSFYVLYDLIFINKLLYPSENTRSQAIIEYFTQYLSLPSGFLLLALIYQRRRFNMFALFVLGLTFILVVIRARRGLMFMSLSMLMLAMVFYQIKNKTKVENIVLSIFFVMIIGFASIKIYEKNSKATFGLITQRIGQHTRNEVEQYFYRDLTFKDWIIGKGMNGQYFCPGVNEGLGRITIYRKVIETGYLQVVLNGGLISLILLLLLAVPAIIKGLFYSKNTLSKAAGIWILLFLLFMYPGTMTIFSLFYILVWISIGICYSGELRSMSDEEIFKRLNPDTNCPPQ